MKDTLLDALKWLLLCAAALGAAFYAGALHERAALQAAETQKVRDAHEKYQAEVQRGQEAAEHYIDDLSDRENRYAELEKKFSALRARVPLVVPAPAAPGPQATGAGPQPDLAAPAPAGPGINVVIRPELSLGAVWMWNSALAGADVPAGACGADAQTVEACAAGSGLTTADAWDNHTANAKSCAADRLRLERLIDYLERRQPASH